MILVLEGLDYGFRVLADRTSKHPVNSRLRDKDCPTPVFVEMIMTARSPQEYPETWHVQKLNLELLTKAKS
jgi:hypothetical protein